MTDFLLLMCGMAGLWLGSETLIKGAMSLADRYRVSDAMFGMLVLAIGTDLPELFIAFDASFRSLAGEDLSGIVIGSAIGGFSGQCQRCWFSEEQCSPRLACLSCRRR